MQNLIVDNQTVTSIPYLFPTVPHLIVVFAYTPYWAQFAWCRSVMFSDCQSFAFLAPSWLDQVVSMNTGMYGPNTSLWQPVLGVSNNPLTIIPPYVQSPNSTPPQNNCTISWNAPNPFGEYQAAFIDNGIASFLTIYPSMTGLCLPFITITINSNHSISITPFHNSSLGSYVVLSESQIV